jgi:RNA polymerase sigma-70 factor (ECF subfamily)
VPFSHNAPPGRPIAVSDDLALVVEFRRTRGEEPFRALYRAHTSSLYVLALRLTGGDDTEAEDLVQECWIRAVRSLDAFRGAGTFGSWLRGILVNVRRERVRADWRFVDAPDFDPLAPEMAFHTTLDLDLAVAALPDGARDVFVLHDVYGYTHAEIGRLLGIMAGTSKSQLNRARTLIRQRVERTED